MTAYLIVRVKVTDPEAYKEYTAQTPGVIASFGGEFVVRGGDVESIEGPAEDRRIVVVKFESMDQLKTFYYSDAYQAILPIRMANSESEAIMVEGVA